MRMSRTNRLFYIYSNLLVKFGGTPHEDFIRKLISRVEDASLCNNSCKDLYFCELKAKHQGRHQDGGLFWD